MVNKTSEANYLKGLWANETLINKPELCTLETCDLDLASFRYLPTVAGNAIFAAIFGIFIFAQLGLGIKYKTWGYMAVMVFGLALELVGYAGRIMIHDKPFDDGPFLQYLVTLTIAPALLTAAIYLCLGRIVNVYGTHLSWFKPRTYTIVFCTFDFICLILQAAGGAIASISETYSGTETGRKIMIAGIIFQVIAIGLFMITASIFAWSVYKGRGTWNPKYASVTNSLLFKSFLVGLVLATVTIQIRSIYRCVELWGGFDSELFEGHEATFMILEGVMIVIACACLTFLHPGVCFRGAFHDTNFNFRTKKGEALKSRDSQDEESGLEMSTEYRGAN